jgi:hypothetical protein
LIVQLYDIQAPEHPAVADRLETGEDGTKDFIAMVF